MAGGLAGGGKGGSGGGGLPPVAIGPGQAGDLFRNMASDAGVGGVGWNPPGTQRTGSPTPDLQYDIAGAEAGPANLANLTNQQIALTQGNQAQQNQAGNQFAQGFNTSPSSSSNAPNLLGNPTGGDPVIS